MNGKVLFLLALVLGLVFFLLERSEQQSSSDLDSKALLGAVSWDQIRSIKIIKNTDQILLRLEDSKWLVGGSYNYPAEYSQVREFLFKLSRMSGAVSVPLAEDKASELGLNKEKGTEVVFMDGDGEILSSFLIGSERDLPSNIQPGLIRSGGYYVSDQEGNSYLVSEDLDISVTPKRWISRSVLSVLANRVVKVEQLRLLGQEYQREFELDRLWHSPTLKHPTLSISRELNASRVSSIHNALENLRIEDVRRATDLTVNFDQKTKFSTDSGLVYVVETGQLEDNFYMRLSAESDAGANSDYNRHSQEILEESKKIKSKKVGLSNENTVLEEEAVSAGKDLDSAQRYQPVPLVGGDTVEKINEKHAGWVYQVAEFTSQKFRYNAGAMSQVIQQ